jgi:RNA-directed DNA polymerase
VVDAGEGSFDFLGFTIAVRRGIRTCKECPLTRPSKKALKRIRAEIKRLTCARTHALSERVIIQKVNETVRGWTGYFYFGHCSKKLSSLKHYLENRVRTWLRKKHRVRDRGYKELSV